jgi:hypothetical protein
LPNESKAERHIRFLARWRSYHRVAEGSLAGHLNTTKLVKSMDCSWAEQERRICGDAQALAGESCGQHDSLE